ncbi:hypothetical protein PoB_006861600 [Plakobranchus ocellatus]|uniref:Uncharacterized protein n=1 Tax=Plakobranchus ocellatus TaxID=259542 RepID=A0AAV4DDE3_9GAST|nr:hypothetical protein PoB_006861600 [Plakobranchus ocellatus]
MSSNIALRVGLFVKLKSKRNANFSKSGFHRMVLPNETLILEHQMNKQRCKRLQQITSSEMSINDDLRRSLEICITKFSQTGTTNIEFSQTGMTNIEFSETGITNIEFS